MEPIYRYRWLPSKKEGCYFLDDDIVVIAIHVFLSWFRILAYKACTTTGGPLYYIDPNSILLT
jgi:hypothetical protein